MVVSCRENAIYKGTENDTAVMQPCGIVTRLVKAGLLPRTAEVSRHPFPGKSYFKRSALFGVTFVDLAKRAEAIQDYIDFENPKASPLDGKQTMTLLTEMIAHAAVVCPESYQDDAMLQGLLNAVADPAMFKALTTGASGALGDWVQVLKGAD